MRVSCPCCSKRFDIPHGAVLAEARRLKEAKDAVRSLPKGAVLIMGPSADMVSSAILSDPNGNVLDPADAEALAARQAAIERRKVGGA